MQEWTYEEDEEVRMGTAARVVSVGLLVTIGLVALSMIPAEADPLWQVVYGVAGLGSIVFGVKAARE